MTSHKKFLLILFSLAFCLRACTFITLIQKDQNAWFYPDSEQYHTAALQYAQGNGGINPDGSPQMYRLPGYPLFLAANYYLFGQHVNVALWVQIILASLIPILIFFLSLVLFPSQLLIAQGAGIFAAVHVGLCVYAGMVATETLSLVVLLCFFILFFSNFMHSNGSRRPSSLTATSRLLTTSAFSCSVRPECFSLRKMYRRVILRSPTEPEAREGVSKDMSGELFLAGLILGIASLIRPIGHYTLAICILLLMLQHDPSIYFSKRKTLLAFAQGFGGHSRANGDLGVHLKNCTALTVGWLLMVAPWLIRNFMITGSLFFHTLPGLHFLQYAAANVIMERDNSAYDVVRPMLLGEWDDAIALQEKTHDRVLNEYERCVIAEKIAFGYMKQYPWLTIKTSLIQMLKSCCSLYTAQPLLSDSGTWPGYTRQTTIWTKIKRFLFPAVKHPVLIPMIYAEILGMIFMLLGMSLFCVSLIFRPACLSAFLRALPFMLMIIFITLAYGCARLRFPIEPFLIIFSVAGWVWIYDYMRKQRSAF